MSKTRVRSGDTLAVLSLVPAVIDYADVLEAVRLEPDSLHDFFDCDGLEHEKHEYSVGYGGVYLNGTYENDYQEMRGYVSQSRDAFVVTIDKAIARRDGWGSWDKKGASKQVREELLAANIQSTLDWIVKCYSGEVEAVGIVCEFTAPDGEEYEASVWGFESEYPENDEYIESSKHDIASAVVSQLEAAGFEVVNQPEPVAVPVHNYRVRDGVNRDNWRGEVMSVYKARERHNRRHGRKLGKVLA